MTVRAKHTFVSAKADSGDATLVQPSNWNADHSLHILGPALVGKGTAGDGAASEVTVGAGLSLSTANVLTASANTSISSLLNNVAYSTPASTAANLEANTNCATVFSYTLAAGKVVHLDAIFRFTTAATTTGVALGLNFTTGAATVNTSANVHVSLPVTNAAAATAVERINNISSTTAAQTIGVAILNTASTTTQGGRITASVTNRGTTATTIRLVIGTEINASAVTAIGGSTCVFHEVTVV